MDETSLNYSSDQPAARMRVFRSNLAAGVLECPPRAKYSVYARSHQHTLLDTIPSQSVKVFS